MKTPTMLYKLGSEFQWHGVGYNTIVVDADDISDKLKEGWCANPNDLNSIIDNSAPSREELELKANELGIKFDGRTNDKVLSKKIEESLNVVE